MDEALAIDINHEAIEAFCRKWNVVELSLFGSVLRANEFRANSDVDVLVTFGRPRPDLGGWGEGWETMRSELAQIFGRTVDLVEKGGVTNPFRRHHILTSMRVIYAA